MGIRIETACKDKWYYYNMLLFILFFWVLKFKISSLRKTNHSWFSKSTLINRPFIINIFSQTGTFVCFIANNALLTLLLHLLNWAYLLKTKQRVIILKSKNYIFYDSDYPYWGFFTELTQTGYLCANKKRHYLVDLCSFYF